MKEDLKQLISDFLDSEHYQAGDADDAQRNAQAKEHLFKKLKPIFEQLPNPNEIDYDVIAKELVDLIQQKFAEQFNPKEYKETGQNNIIRNIAVLSSYLVTTLIYSENLDHRAKKTGSLLTALEKHTGMQFIIGANPFDFSPRNFDTNNSLKKNGRPFLSSKYGVTKLLISNNNHLSNQQKETILAAKKERDNNLRTQRNNQRKKDPTKSQGKNNSPVEQAVVEAISDPMGFDSFLLAQIFGKSNPGDPNTQLLAIVQSENFNSIPTTINSSVINKILASEKITADTKIKFCLALTEKDNWSSFFQSLDLDTQENINQQLPEQAFIRQKLADQAAIASFAEPPANHSSSWAEQNPNFMLGLMIAGGAAATIATGGAFLVGLAIYYLYRSCSADSSKSDYHSLPTNGNNLFKSKNKEAKSMQQDNKSKPHSATAQFSPAE